MSIPQAEGDPPFSAVPDAEHSGVGPAAFLITGRRVHIHASFDAEGLEDLARALPLLIQIIRIPGREPTLAAS